MTEATPTYRSLEFEKERRALVADIKKIRQEALYLVNLVPKEHWYQPRYQDSSLAAILSYLQAMDDFSLSTMQAALRGVAVPVPKGAFNLFTGVMSRVFRNHDLEITLRDIQKDEGRVIAFVLRLTPAQLQQKVYDPGLERYLTLEEAVQECFFHRWQEHLQVIREAEDQAFYEPTAGLNTL